MVKGLGGVVRVEEGAVGLEEGALAQQALAGTLERGEGEARADGGKRGGPVGEEELFGGGAGFGGSSGSAQVGKRGQSTVGIAALRNEGSQAVAPLASALAEARHRLPKSTEASPHFVVTCWGASGSSAQVPLLRFPCRRLRPAHVPWGVTGCSPL